MLIRRNSIITTIKIVLSALTTSSLIIAIWGDSKTSTMIGALLSTLLLILTLYVKEFEIARSIEEHRTTIHRLLEIREEYLSLLTDLDFIPIKQIVDKRNALQQRLSQVYAEAPRTNSKAYQKAQTALKYNEERTFSDEEIDLLLPKKLRLKQNEEKAEK